MVLPPSGGTALNGSAGEFTPAPIGQPSQAPTPPSMVQNQGQWGKFAPGGSWHPNTGNRFGAAPTAAQQPNGGMVQNQGGEWGKYAPGGSWHPNSNNRFGAAPQSQTMNGVSPQPYMPGQINDRSRGGPQMGQPFTQGMQQDPRMQQIAQLLQMFRGQ